MALTTNMTLNNALLKIAKAYMQNKLTLGSAYHLGFQAISEYEATGGVGYTQREAKHHTVLRVLNYKSSRDDLLTQELGFNGNHYDWFEAGNRPAGWYMTRKEYLCTVTTEKAAAEMVADATCSAEKADVQANLTKSPIEKS